MFTRKLKKKWFQDEDGTYFRNVPTILGELDVLLARRWFNARAARELQDELAQAWDNTLRKDRPGPDDVLVQAMPFRQAYPTQPELWKLDNLK